MEFIDGVGLDRVIAAAGRLPVERAAPLAAQVADGLDFAHRHNVVHRDIKPANIMIEGGDRVKVTDFGIARVIDSVDNLTATGSLLGTPSYMSPEQARGTALDGRSDLFAVGCILYEMVVGKKAFRGESITGLIFKIITEEPPPMRELEPNVPDELVRIVAKALAKSPDGRYQTGRELADDLLALTRAGSTPTLRQSETDTTPGLDAARHAADAERAADALRRGADERAGRPPSDRPAAAADHADAAARGADRSSRAARRRPGAAPSRRRCRGPRRKPRRRDAGSRSRPAAAPGCWSGMGVAGLLAAARGRDGRLLRVAPEGAGRPIRRAARGHGATGDGARTRPGHDAAAGGGRPSRRLATAPPASSGPPRDGAPRVEPPDGQRASASGHRPPRDRSARA